MDRELETCVKKHFGCELSFEVIQMIIKFNKAIPADTVKIMAA